jgi:hypothetical protein
MARAKGRWIRRVGFAFGALAVVWLVLVFTWTEATVENSFDTDRSPEEVFDYASDMRHELEWNPDVQSMAKVTDGPVGLGTKFHAKWKQSDQVEVECTRYERPGRLTLDNGGAIEGRVDVTITPQGNGSHFVSRFTARPHGTMRLVFPIFVAMMGKFEAANMRYLKKAIESQPAQPSG